MNTCFNVYCTLDAIRDKRQAISNKNSASYRHVQKKQSFHNSKLIYNVKGIYLFNTFKISNYILIILLKFKS